MGVQRTGVLVEERAERRDTRRVQREVAVGVGLTVVAWMGIYTVLIGELAGVRRSGSAIGGAQGFMRAGMTAFPPAFGYMADASGSYALGWLVMAGLGSVATLGLLVFGKEQPRATT